jgi:hypothetical protein
MIPVFCCLASMCVGIALGFAFAMVAHQAQSPPGPVPEEPIFTCIECGRGAISGRDFTEPCTIIEATFDRRRGVYR